MKTHTSLFSDTFDLPLADIHADPARFQGRLGEYSEDTVNAIVNKGHYDRSKSPITVWRDPRDKRFYILSGHSRHEAAKRIHASGKQPELASIPVKQMMVDDVDRAIEYAVLESNRKSTEEGLIPDLKAYRTAVSLGKNKEYLLSIFRPESRFQRLKELSTLNPKGMFVEQLAAPSQHSFPYLERNARWVGNMRAQFPALTDAHERELFDYLYGSTKGLNVNKQKFFDLVNSKVSRFDFDPANALNLSDRISPTAYTDTLAEQVREIDKHIETAQKEIERHRTTLARAKSEGIEAPMYQGRITLDARISELNGYIIRKMQEKATVQQNAGRLERNMGGDLFSQVEMAPAPKPVVEKVPEKPIPKFKVGDKVSHRSSKHGTIDLLKISKVMTYTGGPGGTDYRVVYDADGYSDLEEDTLTLYKSDDAPKSTVEILRQLNDRDPEKRKEAKAAMKPSSSPTSIVNPKATPSQKMLGTLSHTVDAKPGNYYVSAVIGGKTHLLLGPFIDNHKAALECVDAVATVARDDSSGRGAFASYGTVRFGKNDTGGSVFTAGKLNEWWSKNRPNYPQPSTPQEITDYIKSQKTTAKAVMYPEMTSPQKAHNAAMAAVKEVVNDVKAGRAFTSFNEIKKNEVVIWSTSSFGSALVYKGNKVFFTENGTPVRPKLKDIRRPRPDEQEKVDKVLIGQFIPEYYLKHPQYKGNPIERQLRTVTLYPWNRVVSTHTPDKAIAGKSIFYDSGELSPKKESSYYVVLGKTIQRIDTNANAKYVSVHTPEADYRLADSFKLYMDKPMFKPKEGAMVKLKELVSTKQNPERSYIVATARMMEAAYGDGEPRGPLNVEKMPDGRYHVKDGNATFEVARRAGWAQLPVIIDNDPATDTAKKKKLMAMKAKAAAARARALNI